MATRISIVALIAILGTALGYGLLELTKARTFQLFGEIIPRVATDEKVVALTFDDGPTEHTADILSILDDADIKATFFLVGADMAAHEAEARQIVAAGHEIGNHSYSHQRMVFKSPSFVRDELEKTDALIRRIGSEGDIHFRPPYGKKLVSLPYYLETHGRKTIMWDIEPESYVEIAADSDRIVAHVRENVTPGSIILLHVMYGNRASIESIRGIVDALTADGYTFKTVSELLAYQQ